MGGWRLLRGFPLQLESGFFSFLVSRKGLTKSWFISSLPTAPRGSLSFHKASRFFSHSPSSLSLSLSLCLPHRCLEERKREECSGGRERRKVLFLLSILPSPCAHNNAARDSPIHNSTPSPLPVGNADLSTSSLILFFLAGPLSKSIVF